MSVALDACVRLVLSLHRQFLVCKPLLSWFSLDFLLDLVLDLDLDLRLNWFYCWIVCCLLLLLLLAGLLVLLTSLDDRLLF